MGRVLREHVQRLRREGRWVYLSMPASRSRLCCPRASETRRSWLALLAGPKGAPTEGTCEGGECGGGEGSGGEGERLCHGVVKVHGPRGLPRGARQMRLSRRRRSWIAAWLHPPDSDEASGQGSGHWHWRRGRVRPCRCGAVQNARAGWRASLCAKERDAQSPGMAWALRTQSLESRALVSDACSRGGDRLASGGAIGRGV